MYNSMREIELKCYPHHMLSMQDVHTLEDLQEYCESSKVKVFGDDTWYCIVAKREVVDLASINKLDLKTLFQLLTDLKGWFGTKSFTMDCKKDTSYRLIKRLESQGTLVLKKEISWDWEGVEMVHLKVKFK